MNIQGPHCPIKTRKPEKLTLVSIKCKGTTHSAFCKVDPSTLTETRLFQILGLTIPKGTTYTIV